MHLLAFLESEVAYLFNSLKKSCKFSEGMPSRQKAPLGNLG